MCVKATVIHNKPNFSWIMWAFKHSVSYNAPAELKSSAFLGKGLFRIVNYSALVIFQYQPCSVNYESTTRNPLGSVSLRGTTNMICSIKPSQSGGIERAIIFSVFSYVTQKPVFLAYCESSRRLENPLALHVSTKQGPAMFDLSSQQSQCRISSRGWDTLRPVATLVTQTILKG